MLWSGARASPHLSVALRRELIQLEVDRSRAFPKGPGADGAEALRWFAAREIETAEDQPASRRCSRSCGGSNSGFTN